MKYKYKCVPVKGNDGFLSKTMVAVTFVLVGYQEHQKTWIGPLCVLRYGK